MRPHAIYADRSLQAREKQNHRMKKNLKLANQKIKSL